MTTLKLAVISDLHVGHKARSKDLCPHADSKQLEERYLEKFMQFVGSQNISADYLLIPGDITSKANPSEFQLASEVIQKIAKALGVVEKNIIFVPGNHDKDWSVMQHGEVDTTGVRAAQMYASIRHTEWIFEQILRRSSHDMLAHPCAAIWDYDDLLVVGYNSAHHDDVGHAIHHGLVRQESLSWLEGQLQQMDMGPQKLKIFLVHHHPITYSDVIPDIPDFSGMANAENLLKLLGQYKFDLLLHGHKHVPHFTAQMNNGSQPLVILGAGSFSYELEHSYNGHASNQFHLIEIESRDQDTECVCGLINSWSYLSGHGWTPSEKHLGIPHKLGFGFYTFPSNLKNRLRPMLQEYFERFDHVKWSDLVAQDNRLKYLPHDAVEQALRDLGEELNAEYWGDKLETAILLRRTA